jgi:dTDP-4-amino-4,6-dideoxygalactose transaminase
LSIAKLNSTGQGGLVVTKNKETYEKLKRIRTHGVDDVINCNYSQMGFNFRFTDLQAAIGIERLNSIQDYITRVKEIYARYEEGLKDLPFLKLIPVSVEKGAIPIYVEVLCKEREKLISFLAAQDIQTRPFYPDLNTAPYLGASGEFPNARVFGEQGLFLPSGPGQSLKNIDRVIETLELFGKKYHETRHQCAK